MGIRFTSFFSPWVLPADEEPEQEILNDVFLVNTALEQVESEIDKISNHVVMGHAVLEQVDPGIDNIVTLDSDQ